MKFLFILLGCMLLAQALAGTPAVPPEVAAQWAKFQTALKAADLSALASMSRFPIHSNEFGGDIQSAKMLAKRYKTIFPDQTSRCLATSSLRAEQWDHRTHYDVGCDVGQLSIRFIFEQIGSRLYFTTIDNVNE